MKHLRFWFDPVSPYAYLAFEHLPQALEGLSYTVDYQPLLFAGLLKHWGQRGPAEIEPKRVWTFREVAWQAHQLGIPIDIGPTALFYRFDIMEKYGLPADPDELAKSIRTWDEYFELGKQLKSKSPDTFLVRNSSGVFDTAWKQSGKSFIDESGMFIGDQDHIKGAWDTAVKAIQAGIVAALESDTADSSAAVAAGKLPADFGASWHLADLVNDAPKTKGM